MKLFKFTYLFAIVFSVAFMFSSCSNDETDDKKDKVQNANWKSNVFGSIDGTIAFIGSFDFMGILEKSSIMDADIIPEMYKSMAMGYIDSDNLGIQLEGNNHFAVIIDENGELDYAFAFANVLDASKIRKNLHMYLGGRTDKEDGYEFLKTSEGAVFGWDDQHLIVAVSDIKKMNVNEIKSKVKSLLDARDKESEVDDQLLTYLKRDDDSNMYINMQSYMKFITNVNNELNVNKELNDLYSNEDFLKFMDYSMVNSVNFNNGEIVFDLEILNNNNAFRFLKDKPLSAEYLNYLTDNDRLIASGFMNIDLASYSSILKLILDSNMDVYEEFNEFLVQMGLSEDEIFNIFNGEMAFSVIDIVEPENKIEEGFSDDFGEWEDDFFDEIEYSSKEKSPSFLVTLGINDQSSLMKLMANAPVDFISDQVIEIENDVHLLLKGNKLFIGSPLAIMNDLNANGKLNTYTKIQSIDHPIFCYLNTDESSFPDNVIATLENEGGTVAFNEIMSVFSSFEIIGSNQNIRYELKLNNKSENSLKQIVDMILKFSMSENPNFMNV